MLKDEVKSFCPFHGVFGHLRMLFSCMQASCIGMIKD